MAPTLEADYFDGAASRARRVRLSVEAGELLIAGGGVAARMPMASVRWPERTRHGPRVAHLDGGGSLHALCPRQWDDWSRASGVAESMVVKAQQNWRATGLATLLLVALGVCAYVWGVPALARAGAEAMPASVERALGDAALAALEPGFLRPSRVAPQRQAQVREAFSRAVATAYADGTAPRWELRFHASAQAGSAGLGANAFALPGGTIIVTDEMLALLSGRDDVLLGVLAHELGHVRHRHGVRQLLHAGAIGLAASAAWGDFSGVLAAAPVLLGQAGYSRDFERQADDEAIRVLRANGMSPAVMAQLFERLADARQDGGQGGSRIGIALSTHPADAERVRRFQDAAGR
jgi:Zn-dependent protease with chaperone function